MKAQVSLFIIVGIVLLIVIFGMLYIATTFVRKDVEDTARETITSSSEIKPITNYVQACIEEVAKEGLILLGKQGGNIYENQGGKKTNFRPSMLGTFYLEYENSHVPYKITLPVTGPTCDAHLPGYPTQSRFPYPYEEYNPTQNNDFSNPSYITSKRYFHQDCFGKRKVLDIERSLEDLEAFMEQKIAQSCDFSAFRNYDIQQNTPDVYIESFPTTIVINTSYPLTVTNKNTQARTTLEQFRTNLKFELEELYNYANLLLEQDTADPTFDISLTSTNYDFSIFVERDIYQKDDVVIITSNSQALGVPYNFVFARRNRYPVLEHVYDTSFQTVSLLEGQQIVWNNVIHQELTAVDPDEDDVTLHVTLGEGNNLRALTSTNPYTIQASDVALPKLVVNISATDGQYSDYQLRNRAESFTIT